MKVEVKCTVYVFIYCRRKPFKKKTRSTCAVTLSVQQVSLTQQPRLNRSCAASERVPLLTTMTDPRPKFRIFRFLKLIVVSLVVVVVLLLAAASLRTLSLDVNVGLQLADWEKTNNLSLVIDQNRRKELLANFKGNLPFVVVKV